MRDGSGTIKGGDFSFWGEIRSFVFPIIAGNLAKIKIFYCYLQLGGERVSGGTVVGLPLAGKGLPLRTPKFQESVDRTKGTSEIELIPLEVFL